jgi:DNA polymerase III epsilon subunit family exonuclease
MPSAPYDTPLAEATFVVFDFETTGLKPARGARIVEIGALTLERGRPVGHFLTLVNPGVPVPREATAIHGLTDDDLDGEPPLAEAFPAFLDYAGDAVLVAHNLPFDVSFVVAAAAELGLPPAPNATVDLLGLARHFYPEQPSHSLGRLAAAFAVPNPAPHRSLGDVAVESQFLLAFLEAARDRREAETVGDLALLSRGLPPSPDVDAAAVVALEWAAAAGESRPVRYRGSRGETERSITPLKFKARGGKCYVVAYCHESEGRREFRLDRLELLP